MPSFAASLNSPTPPVSQSSPPSPPCQTKQRSEASSFAKQNWTSLTHQPQLYLATLPTFTPANDAGSSKSLQLGISRPKRKRITPEQLEVLSNLFEYTDTPTFDLREAIGSKLGMSNREVQVWFQNRRAKVNRQRIPSNSQVPQERPMAASGISQQQDPSSASHRRMRSSPNLLLPGVSSILNSESCRGTYSALPLLPPFQATLPGADGVQDAPMYRATPDRYPSSTAPPSPQDPPCSEVFFSSSSKMRPSPPGTRRRLPISTTASLHSRKSPRCQSPLNSPEYPAGPLSPRRLSSDLPALTSESLNPGPTSHWKSGSSHPWSYTDSRTIPQNSTSYMSLGSMRLDHMSQPKVTPTLTTPPQDYSPTSNEPTNQPFEKQFSHPSHYLLEHQSSASIPIPTSRCASESFRFSQPFSPWKSCGGSAPAPTTLPLPSHCEHGRGVNKVESAENCKPLAAPQALRPGLIEDTCSSPARSLFASRYLPPLPNPVRPGPGSFPPPPALRVVPINKDTSSAARISESPHSISEFKLPPLLNEQNES